ncbi:MAG: hypothetical protein GY868_03630, partial [Deltaproteobacteria bacterium]|nr:hypothetical protein [Deltaproteobacteria bacterium]
NPAQQGRVAVVGIAVGNTQEEVLEFKAAFGALYPIVSDRNKRLFTDIGNVLKIPHTDILKRSEDRFVLYHHASGESQYETYASIVENLLRGDKTGVRIGNGVPRFAFAAAGVTYTEKSFSDSSFFLYVPADRAYQHVKDVRASGNQLRVFKTLLKKYPALRILVIPPAGWAVPASIKESAGLHVGVMKGKNPFMADHDGKDPLVYFVNQQGRIGFRGAAITRPKAEDMINGGTYALSHGLEEQEIIGLIEQRIRKSGKRAALTEKVVMGNGKAVYVTGLEPLAANNYLFSSIESRSSLCDVCHDTHFIYTINQQGVIVDLISVQLAKAGNLEWTQKDFQKISKSFIGKSVFQQFPFNPKIDAVTTATLTSSLVFEVLNNGKDHFGDFKQYGFRKVYWTQECMQNNCKVQELIERQQKKSKAPVLSSTTLRLLMSAHALKGCPLGGVYLVRDGDIICSLCGPHSHGAGSHALK